MTSSPAGDDCLARLWRKQSSPDRSFDRTHDRAPGGTISCATGTTAGQFEIALSSIREAARAGDRAELLGQVEFPLLFIDAQGKRRELQRDELAHETFAVTFNPATIDLLAKVRLKDLTVVAGEGAFVELGAVWFVTRDEGGAPHIATINHEALKEAHAASRP